MLRLKGQDLTFSFLFTSEGGGVTHLDDVRVNVYDPENTLIVENNDEDVVEVGDGLYKYTLPHALADKVGIYLAVAKTAYDTIDASTVASAWELPITRQIWNPFVCAGVVPTLADLIEELRSRLDDLREAHYTEDDLIRCINTAYRETQMLGKCYEYTLEVELVQGQALYCIPPIFEPLEVLVDDVSLKKSTLRDLAIGHPGSVKTEGTPQRWARVGGKSIRLSPVPDDSVTSLEVYGFGVACDMKLPGDTPDALPPGFDFSVMLDRAEALARRRRVTRSYNAELVLSLTDHWQMMVNKMAGSL